jgi:pimeloyl-ACP methyl ester carboxylesterase
VPGLLNLIEATAEVPALERHFARMTSFSTVVMFDKRGTGLSDRAAAAEMADPATRLQDVLAVMDAAGLDQATLLATADGALVAIECAALHPDRVRSLIILQGTARWLVDEGYEAGVPPEMASGPEVWDEFWGNEEQPHVVDLVAPSAAADARWRRVLGRIQRRAGTPAAAWLYWDTTMVRGDVRHLLSQIHVPTLIMHSTDDVIVPVAQVVTSRRTSLEPDSWSCRARTTFTGS